MSSTSSSQRAYLLFLVIEGGWAIFFSLYATVAAIYRVKTAGLDPLQLVLVGTALEISTFVFSIPTGVLADTYSRKLSVIVGTVLVGCGFVLEGAVPRFGVILVAQVVWGVGYTFISGAKEAWITGEMGTDNASNVFVRASQVAQIGTLAGIAGSVALASIRLNFPLLAGGLLTIALGLALIFVMPENGFHPRQSGQHTTLRSMATTLRQSSRLVFAAPALLTVLAAAIFYGMSSEGFDRLWEAHLLTNFHFPPLAGFAPVVWFGVIDATAMLLGIASTELARRTVDTRNHMASLRAFFAINAGLIAGLAVFGLSGSFFVAVGGYLLVSVLRQTRNPIYMAWLAQRTDADVRATVLSMSDQADAFGQIAGGPAIGLVGTLHGLRAALITAAAFLSPSLLFFALAARTRDTVGTPRPMLPVTKPSAPAS